MTQQISRALALALLLSAALGVLVFAHLHLGAFDTSWAQVWGWLWQDDGSNAAFSVREIRLPRVIVALFAGAALAMAGLLIQIITRNPLADPGLTGVTGGAAFGVALAITLLPATSITVLAFGVLGGAVAAVITCLIARPSGFRDIQVLLAGVSVSIFFLAATSALMVVKRSSMQALYYWMIGGFSNKSWNDASLLWLTTICIGALILLLSPHLALLRLDDGVARGLGLRSGLWRLTGAALSVGLTAAAVAVAGPIGFVGFVAPHLLHRLVGYGAQQLPLAILTPLVALTGAVLTLSADLVARHLKMPAGVFVTVIGGVIFLILARQLMRGSAGRR